MIHLKAFVFLALLCVLGSAQFFQVPEEFDVERILDVPWYELAWFDKFEDGASSDCNSYWFTQSSDSNQIAYEYTFTFQDELRINIFSLMPTDESRVFDVINNAVPRTFNILAFAEDYSWIVTGDTGIEDNPFVNILVRDLDADNSAGVAEAEEKAAKYGLEEGRHDVNQDDTCQYDADREQLLAKKEEQEERANFFEPVTEFNVEKLFGGIWYSLVWFDSDDDTTPYGCYSYQFVPSADSSEISYDYSYNYPDIDGSLNYGDYTLAPTDDIHVFDVTDNLLFSRQVNILAYDKDYNWVVFEDTGASLFGDPWVDLIVRSLDNDNSAGVAKAEEEAAKYGFGARHDVNHSDTCQYVDQVFGN